MIVFVYDLQVFSHDIFNFSFIRYGMKSLTMIVW